MWYLPETRDDWLWNCFGSVLSWKQPWLPGWWFHYRHRETVWWIGDRFSTLDFMVLSYMTVQSLLRVTGVSSWCSLIVFWLSLQLFPLVSLCVHEDCILCTLQTCAMWCNVCWQDVIYFIEATPNPWHTQPPSSQPLSSWNTALT